MHLLTNIAALLLVAPAPRATPSPDPEAAAPVDDATAEPLVGPATPDDPAVAPPVEMTGLSEGYAPPFPSEELELSAALQRSLETNLDLAANAIDTQVSEAQVLAALGAYDVFIVAGVNGSMSQSPQRGSQFTFALAQRQVGANFGVRRKLETGGTISFDLRANRTLTEQPVNFFNANAGSFQLASYAIVPTLSVTHPLLRGAGLRVNRADIDRARIAVSSAEANRQLIAQNIVRDIISAYWDLLFAHRDLENKRRSVELARKQLERTQALVAAGRLSPVDAKAVEQALAARESDVINAENALLQASLNLHGFMGDEYSLDTMGVLPVTDPVVKPRMVDMHAELETALAANPQIRQLQLAIASRRIDEIVAANARLPQLDVGGSFTPQGRSVDTIPDATTGAEAQTGSWPEAFRNIFSDDVRSDGLLADWTLTGQITLTWDVQNRGPKGQHEAAILQIERAELELERARRQVTDGVIRASNGLRTAAKVMEVAEISLELSKENLEAEQARFEVGRSTNYDVLQRLDEVDRAAASALSAQINYLKALVQLQALNGEILPAYGIDLP